MSTMAYSDKRLRKSDENLLALLNSDEGAEYAAWLGVAMQSHPDHAAKKKG